MIEFLEGRQEINSSNLPLSYGKFLFSRLEKGQGLTLANTLRRILLYEFSSLGVTSVSIHRYFEKNNLTVPISQNRGFFEGNQPETIELSTGLGPASEWAPLIIEWPEAHHFASLVASGDAWPSANAEAEANQRSVGGKVSLGHSSPEVTASKTSNILLKCIKKFIVEKEYSRISSSGTSRAPKWESKSQVPTGGQQSEGYRYPPPNPHCPQAGKAGGLREPVLMGTVAFGDQVPAEGGFGIARGAQAPSGRPQRGPGGHVTSEQQSSLNTLNTSSSSGFLHEFSFIPGIKENLIQILNNIQSLVWYDATNSPVLDTSTRLTSQQDSTARLDEISGYENIEQNYETDFARRQGGAGGALIPPAWPPSATKPINAGSASKPSNPFLPDKEGIARQGGFVSSQQSVTKVGTSESQSHRFPVLAGLESSEATGANMPLVFIPKGSAADSAPVTKGASPDGRLGLGFDPFEKTENIYLFLPPTSSSDLWSLQDNGQSPVSPLRGRSPAESAAGYGYLPAEEGIANPPCPQAGKLLPVSNASGRFAPSGRAPLDSKLANSVNAVNLYQSNSQDHAGTTFDPQSQLIDEGGTNIISEQNLFCGQGYLFAPESSALEINIYASQVTNPYCPPNQGSAGKIPLPLRSTAVPPSNNEVKQSDILSFDGPWPTDSKQSDTGQSPGRLWPQEVKRRLYPYVRENPLSQLGYLNKKKVTAADLLIPKTLGLAFPAQHILTCMDSDLNSAGSNLPLDRSYVAGGTSPKATVGTVLVAEGDPSRESVAEGDQGNSLGNELRYSQGGFMLHLKVERIYSSDIQNSSQNSSNRLIAGVGHRNQDRFILPIDGRAFPIKRVNYTIEQDPKSFKGQGELVFFEIWTNGSITPKEAVSQAIEKSISLFQKYQ
jgi:DNA-directed RNA polymerase alpha subunit